jgi:hypothetical protein
MKRASYRQACDWIAWNDDWDSRNSNCESVVAKYLSTKLVADLFGLETERVAKDVVRLRNRADENDRRAMARSERER